MAKSMDVPIRIAMRAMLTFHIGAPLLAVNIVSAQELAGHKLLLTSVRTGNTELFVVDPVWGDAQNVSRSPSSEERYACWSPDGKQIAFISDRTGTPNLFVMNADGDNGYTQTIKVEFIMFLRM